MKILHTADWHLGVRTEGRSRINEQREIMSEIVKIARDEKIDVVLISGDIYDQAVPTSEAEDLFYETLEKLTKDEDRRAEERGDPSGPGAPLLPRQVRDHPDRRHRRRLRRRGLRQGPLRRPHDRFHRHRPHRRAGHHRSVRHPGR